MKYSGTLALLLAASTAFADARLDVPYAMRQLPNGLTVIVHEDHSVPLVAVNVWYHVGSARETPGRTGLAHLFEHLMFEGSKNVPEGAFDRWLEAVGGSNNASVRKDRTHYWIDVPANALEIALFLESDRMAHLLETMTPARVDGQRDVVKNERRQTYENTPYGMAEIHLDEALYPEGHPYRWPIIGSMDDLTAASHEDVAAFFRRWYAPGNASLVIAGDVTADEGFRLAEKWFSEVPAGAPVPPAGTQPVTLATEKRIVAEDQIQLPRLYLRWPTPPFLSPSDAALDAVAGVLAGGKNARLYRRLVYELQAAQDVSAYQDSRTLGSVFDIVVTARAGRTLSELQAIVDDEIARLQAEPPTDRELERFRTQREASFLTQLESVGGFTGKAEQLNAYFFATGNPDYFEEDLARYRALSAVDVQAAARRHLGRGRVALSVVPQGRRTLGLPESEVVR